MYQYKDQSIDDVKFEAKQQDDGSWVVKFPLQQNEVVYSDEVFKANFQEVTNAV